MIQPTYEQQWQKITEAYMRNEIQPYHPNFCFCGTLCDNSNDWFQESGEYHRDFGIYKGKDFVKMEVALLSKTDENVDRGGICISEKADYEQAIFEGMVDALEELRKIHEAKGDPTAKPIALQKRILCAS